MYMKTVHMLILFHILVSLLTNICQIKTMTFLHQSKYLYKQNDAIKIKHMHDLGCMQAYMYICI